MTDGPMIIISDVLEYLFCPRFIYYMHCLAIPQHQELKYKVLRGREVHEARRIENPDYLRKRLGVVGRELDVFVASKTHHVKGIVDEVLTLEDGTLAPFEYKFAEFKGRIHPTYRYQLVLHAMMIRENYGRDVGKGFVCFTRSGNHIEEVVFTARDLRKSEEIVEDILKIIETGAFPGRSSTKAHCVGCCYGKICA
jgi:CRISPR-associated exonuclease Cas4